MKQKNPVFLKTMMMHPPDFSFGFDFRNAVSQQFCFAIKTNYIFVINCFRRNDGKSDDNFPLLKS